MNERILLICKISIYSLCLFLIIRLCCFRELKSEHSQKHVERRSLQCSFIHCLDHHLLSNDSRNLRIFTHLTAAHCSWHVEVSSLRGIVSYSKDTESRSSNRDISYYIITELMLMCYFCIILCVNILRHYCQWENLLTIIY